MEHELVKQQLIEWMVDFVEKPNSMLGDWAPCPYARAARLNNKMLVLESKVQDLQNTVTVCLSEFDKYDVVVICFDHTLISAEDCAILVGELNNQLMPNNFVLLEDHPDNIEIIAGVQMNFGKSGLLIMSPLTDLNRASQLLLKHGYYKQWSAQNLDEVVNWRTR